MSDTTRRAILDLLRHGPWTTTQIVEAFPHLSRFGDAKGLGITGRKRARRAAARNPATLVTPTISISRAKFIL